MATFQASRIFKHHKYTEKALPPTPPQVWQHPLYFIAFGFGSGAIPFAPGTCGTLVAIPFFLLIQPLSLFNYMMLVLLLIVFSSLLCSHLSKHIQVHDHPGMNIDEFIGFFVTMIAMPPTFFYITLGFILFRFFDILKPWPIHWIDQHMTNGFGMILDDVLAGAYSLFILHLIRIALT